MESTTLDSKRICYACGSDKSWHNKWLLNWGTSLLLCTRCYARLFLHPKWNPRKFKYKGKEAKAWSEPKIGRCSWCPNNLADGSCKQTQWHHTKYDDDNPLANRIELCASCHRKETMRLEPERFRRPRNPVTGRFMP
jgi:hypothetical protein